MGFLYNQIKELKNLIWVYSPATDQEYDPAIPDQENYNLSAERFWPCENCTKYVDIIGLDKYEDKTGQIVVSGYEELVRKGKPIGLAEFGPCPAFDCFLSCPSNKLEMECKNTSTDCECQDPSDEDCECITYFCDYFDYMYLLDLFWIYPEMSFFQAWNCQFSLIKHNSGCIESPSDKNN